MASKKKQGFASMNEDEHREMSRKAGKVSNPNKGFGSLTKKELSKLSSEAAKTRWAKEREKRKAKEEEIREGE